MAVDLANNAYAQRIAMQAAASAEIPEEFLVEARVYYHTHAGARFIFDTSTMNSQGRLIPGTKPVSFVNHIYITRDKREQDQLDLVADVSGSMIYTIPDSDVERAMIAEQNKFSQEEIMKTAAAAAKNSGQQFDPNVPIQPVLQQQGTAIVGAQNSLQGAVAAISTVPVQQKAPPSAAQLALEQLNAKFPAKT